MKSKNRYLRVLSWVDYCLIAYAFPYRNTPLSFSRIRPIANKQRELLAMQVQLVAMNRGRVEKAKPDRDDWNRVQVKRRPAFRKDEPLAVPCSVPTSRN